MSEQKWWQEPLIRIPLNVFERWEVQGLISTLRDLDLKTGIYNEEVRFAASLAQELEKYMVRL